MRINIWNESASVFKVEKEKMQEIINKYVGDMIGIREIDIMNFKAPLHVSKLEIKEERAYILGATTNREHIENEKHSIVETRDLVILNKPISIERLYLSENVIAPKKAILSDCGTEIATFSFANNALYIHFDLLGTLKDGENYDIFEHLVSEMAQIIKAKENIYSVRNEDILKQVQENSKMMNENKIKMLEDKQRETYDILIQKQNEIASLQRNIVAGEREVKIAKENPIDYKYVEQVSDALTLSNVLDIQYRDGRFTVVMETINFTNGEKTWVGNPVNLVIDFGNNEIKFKRATKSYQQKGYWSENDPHPHVNGNNGNPCLGTMSTPLYDMIARKDLYSTILLAQQFLQAVNLEDGAGGYSKYYKVVE